MRPCVFALACLLSANVAAASSFTYDFSGTMSHCQDPSFHPTLYCDRNGGLPVGGTLTYDELAGYTAFHMTSGPGNYDLWKLPQWPDPTAPDDIFVYEAGGTATSAGFTYRILHEFGGVWSVALEFNQPLVGQSTLGVTGVLRRNAGAPFDGPYEILGGVATRTDGGEPVIYVPPPGPGTAGQTVPVPEPSTLLLVGPALWYARRGRLFRRSK